MKPIDDLNTCIDGQYASAIYLQKLKKNQGYRINKILNGYIAYLKKRKTDLN